MKWFHNTTAVIRHGVAETFLKTRLQSQTGRQINVVNVNEEM